jgi:RNA ligase (TIGR02306 family)
MATFEVKIYPIKLEEHPNADALDLAGIGDYRAIVQKGLHEDGNLIAYIPEQAVLPDWLVERMELKGRLAGKAKNRVKAIKLRGVLSQGLVVPLVCDDDGNFIISNENETSVVTVDMDVTEFMGITKYEPPIPVHLAGEVQNLFGFTISYDIENLKKFPDVLTEEDEVVITEKLHGTWACWGYHPECGLVVTSKGQSKAGLAFKDNEANLDNLYMKTLKATAIGDPKNQTALDKVVESVSGTVPVYLLGEIFGGKVQDLKYGLDKAEFRLFDVYLGHPGAGQYANADELSWIAHVAGLALVPILYRGEYTKNKVLELTDGRETVSGKEANIREGVVVRTARERYDSTIGRVQLKSVSEKYLLRRDGTEYN